METILRLFVVALIATPLLSIIETVLARIRWNKKKVQLGSYQARPRE